MDGSIVLGIAALLTLLPAAVLPYSRRGYSEPQMGSVFWLLMLVAAVGPLVLDLGLTAETWRTGFSATLWTIISATMLLYLLVCLLSEAARRLSGLLLPYLVILALIALVWSSVPGRPLEPGLVVGWLGVHIGLSLVTYALVSLAAVASLAVWFRERALRARKVSGWIEILPAIADAEVLQTRLLFASEIVLGAGLLTGMATQFSANGSLISLDHKTTLSILTFCIIGLLLILNVTSGLRGRRATRVVLMGYLSITLAYPGLKFVTDVIMA